MTDASLPSALGRFVTELKRRRVFRVAGVYAVAAWAIVQGTGTVLEMASAPAWAGRLALLLLAIGFPIALGLGWAFDVTHDGIKRTAPVHGTTTRSTRAGRIAAVSAILLLMLSGGGWFTLSLRSDARLDANAVAVLPFHVAADPSLEYLSEGMVDLLSAKLNGEGGPRALDPRSSIAAWRKTVDVATELDARGARKLARRLGAGLVLVGDVARTGATLTMSAKLYDVASGAERATGSVEMPIDSISALVDELAAHLLARSEGVHEQSLASVTTTSLPALKAYLDGARSSRRGEYKDANTHFIRALQFDSTFALAALALHIGANWGDLTDPTFERIRARRLARQYGERLSQRDRAVLDAYLPPDSLVRTVAEVRSAFDRAVAMWPDRADLWFRLGLSYSDDLWRDDDPESRRQVKRYFERAVAVDSMSSKPLEAVARLAAAEGDVATVRRLALRVAANDSSSESAEYLKWLDAAVRRDREGLAAVRSQLSALSPSALGFIALSALHYGIDLEGGEAALEELGRKASTKIERWNYAWRRAEYLDARGRVSEALRVREAAIRERFEDPGFRTAFTKLHHHVVKSPDKTGVEEAVQAFEQQATPGTAVGRACFAGIGYGFVGDAARAQVARRRMQAIADTVTTSTATFGRRIAEACGSLIAALEAQAMSRDDAHALALRADSVFMNFAYDDRMVREFWRLAVAQLLEKSGDVPGALDVMRRRNTFNPEFGIARFLREQGRLSASLGHRDAAIRAYQQYLLLRTDPEPAVRSEVEHVRQELARLIAERS